MVAERSARGEKQSSAGAGKGLAPGDGLALLRTAGQLFVEHWPALAVIAGAGVAAHWYLADLAVRLGRLGAVPGMLGLSLVPFSSLLAVVGMLLVLRRREQSRHVVADLVAAVGSVLIPFLVVYQSTGAMDDDLRNHAYSGVEDDIGREQVAGTIDTTLRIPAATSLTVLAIVAVAILMRAVGGRLVRTERLWSHREDPRRNALQVLVGYCELVWIVLGAYVITYALTNVQTWWESRAVAHWLQGWWSTLEITLPTLGAVGRWLLGAAETLAWGASTALVVPIAWLAIGVIVYGIQATDVIDDTDLARAGNSVRFLARINQRFGDSLVTRAWHSIAEPDSRFGALLGGTAMILRAGWSPVLLFCLAYVAVNQTPYLVWGVVRAIAGQLSNLGWIALYDPIEVVAEILGLMGSAVLLAAATDDLLHRFGAPRALRLPGHVPTGNLK